MARGGTMNILQVGKRLGVFGAVVTLIEAQGHLFDYIAYPAAILWLGVIKGGMLMTVISFLLSYVIIIWYNKTKQDWFGIEWLRLRSIVESKTLSGRMLSFILRLGKWPAYIAITVYDPAYGFIFLRGRQSVGFTLTKADWAWFVVTELIGNLVWILFVSGAIELIRLVF